MKTSTFASIACLSAILASPALAQATADAMTTKTLAENDKLTVSESWLKPGQTAPSASRLGAAFYYIQGGSFELTFKDGTKKMVTREFGSARIGSDAQPYAARNVGKTTIHVIVVQPKAMK